MQDRFSLVSLDKGCRPVEIKGMWLGGIWLEHRFRLFMMHLLWDNRAWNYELESPKRLRFKPYADDKFRSFRI